MTLFLEYRWSDDVLAVAVFDNAASPLEHADDVGVANAFSTRSAAGRVTGHGPDVAVAWRSRGRRRKDVLHAERCVDKVLGDRRDVAALRTEARGDLARRLLVLLVGIRAVSPAVDAAAALIGDGVLENNALIWLLGDQLIK